jgi:hypothetical protein
MLDRITETQWALCQVDDGLDWAIYEEEIVGDTPNRISFLAVALELDLADGTASNCYRVGDPGCPYFIEDFRDKLKRPDGVPAPDCVLARIVPCLFSDSGDNADIVIDDRPYYLEYWAIWNLKEE